MRLPSGRLSLILCALAIFWGGHAQAAVGLTVSPSVISNTYPGYVTLNITGLTNFQSVKVQTYLDLNTNGVIDPGEPLIDVFSLKESGAMIIGGITNVSVPYDSNPATDTLTATLNFAPPQSLDNMVGQRIYRVLSNPDGAFTPVTAVMTITNAALNQSISGVLFSNGVTPLPYAIVVAVTVTNQNYVGATVADGSGHYYLALNPGSYFLLPALPGFYTDQSLAQAVVLTNGMSATNNLYLTNAAVTITGNVSDAGNSNPLGGVFLQGQSGSLFGIAFTDTNGNYSCGATSNNWKLKVTADRLARRAYLAPQGNALTVNAALGNVANANLALYHGNALFYGQLTISNLPVPNVSIACNDQDQIFSGKGFTDAHGNYGVAALVDTNVLAAGTPWYCSPSAGAQIDLLNDFIFNTAQNVSLTANQAAVQNFVGLPVTTTISGHLLNSLGAPIVDVGVGGSATINGLQYVSAFVDTDASGSFTFGVATGTWYVNANCCGNHSLDDQGYYEPGFYQITVPPANPVINLTVYPASQPQLGQPLHGSGTQFDFNLYGVNGYNYTIQSSTNLAATNWPVFTIISNFSGSPFLIQDNQATNATRFYRAFQGP